MAILRVADTLNEATSAELLGNAIYVFQILPKEISQFLCPIFEGNKTHTWDLPGLIL